MNGYFIINQQEVGLWGCSERRNGRAQKEWGFVRLNQIVSADRESAGLGRSVVSSYLVQFLLLSQPLPISLCYNSQEFSLLGFLLFQWSVWSPGACCLSFCSSSLTMSERHRPISLCNSTNQLNRFRWIVCFLHFPVMSRLAWFDNPCASKGSLTHTHTHTQRPVKKQQHILR